MKTIAEEGCGVLIYEQQEGRGIGLMAKLQAYALQDQGLDTITANHALGFEADCRDFSLPAAILNDLGIRQVRLLSNNPEKRAALAKAGIDVVAQIPCEVFSESARRQVSKNQERTNGPLALARLEDVRDMLTDCFEHLEIAFSLDVSAPSSRQSVRRSRSFKLEE